jgi:hypothetical protein
MNCIFQIEFCLFVQIHHRSNAERNLVHRPEVNVKLFDGAWSVILREDRRLVLFEKVVRWRIFGSKWRRFWEVGENYRIRTLMTCTVQM